MDVYKAIRDDGTQKYFLEKVAATKWLAGLKPEQSWDEFQYPAPGGRVFDILTGKAVVGVGADGGAVSFDEGPDEA